MLTIDGITLRLGGHVILDHACAALPPKARVGLVGRNGSGKSSLLKLIAGIYEPDDGSIEMPSGMRIGYVAQEAPGGRGTPFDTVIAAATERPRPLDEAERAAGDLPGHSPQIMSNPGNQRAIAARAQTSPRRGPS
jgi:ATP-binding cassette subfamily F protein 3